jgi:hypothetical protein
MSMHVWTYHACNNDHCELRLLEAPGAEPGHCPRCGWVRKLARVVVRRLGS